jgi:AcrR family transcriptional regulator
MARPRSEDKRNAIIAAAVAEFAVRGVWSTPTSVISKTAGIAEGTLFTYFATKEILINEIYRELKRELAEVIMSSYPQDAEPRARFFHFWKEYVNWGARFPAKVNVLGQLRYSDQITEENRIAGAAAFISLNTSLNKCIQEKIIRDYPIDFIGAMFGGLADVTMDFVKNGKDYCAAGFDILWRGIALESDK